MSLISDHPERTRRLSTATLSSSVTFVVAGVFSLLTIDHGVLSEIFSTICFLSIPVVLVAAALDLRRKRYWALAVLGGLSLVGALGLLIAYIAVHTVIVD